ncbi:MAG: hypothetical protein ABSD62_13845 [Candidatus Limnocylindrales bacterium]|jgi:hypothetical protein
MDPVELNEPVPGSYSSAEDTGRFSSLQPPAIKTRPSFNLVSVCAVRAVAMDPVGLNLPVVGSYSSADARGVPGRTKPVVPPAISTLPFVSRVAVCHARVLDIDPVGLNVPLAGS